jgi:hypothetical protein
MQYLFRRSRFTSGGYRYLGLISKARISGYLARLRAISIKGIEYPRPLFRYTTIRKLKRERETGVLEIVRI